MNKKRNAMLSGILMALAWSLRGQFGHLPGAAIPGIAAALIAVMMIGGRWQAALGFGMILGAYGFSAGGHIGYGKFFETVSSNPFLECLPAFGMIFLSGALWGSIGMTFLGFAFCEKTLQAVDVLVVLGISLVWFFVLNLWSSPALDFGLLSGGLMVLHGYNFLRKKSKVVSFFGFWGAVGFGAAFLFSGLLLHAGNHFLAGRMWPFWALRDQWFGFLAGLTVWGILTSAGGRGLFPSLMHDIVAFHRMGGIVAAAIIPGINLLNVFLYWREKGTLEMHHYWLLAAVPMAIAGCLYFTLTEEDGFSIRLNRTLRKLTIFFCWILSVLAIAKETFVFGAKRWEASYFLFLIFSILITLALGLRKYPKIPKV